MSSNQRWLLDLYRDSKPAPQEKSVVAWAEKNCRFPGSPLGEEYRVAKTPWTAAPLEDGNRPGIKRVTYIKPIQSGGSTVGEILLCFWAWLWSAGNIAYFWPTGVAAELRWRKQTERVLRACPALQDKLPPDDRNAWIDGLIRFVHLNLEMKGANSDRAVASDTLRGIICEELHDVEGWTPGRLRQVFGRLTLAWNGIAYLISNAGIKGSELHKAHQLGTQRYWTVKCPGCSNPYHEANAVYHEMRTRWDDEHPELGGLRYSLPEGRKHGEEIDYRLVASTVRYQFPCGFPLHNDKAKRRALSLTGRYSDPTNTNAMPGHESYRLQAVSVHDIDWLTLVEEKHVALRARKLGDARLWLIYLRERETEFTGLDDNRPEAPAMVLSTRKKDRIGLVDREFRFCFFDYQKGVGERGESPHWWGVIWDVNKAGDVLLVYEGKSESEGEVLDVVRRHDVKPICVGMDASFTGEDRYIYFFCHRHGFNAIKVHGRNAEPFMHKDKIRRAWSEPEPLYKRLSNDPGPTVAEHEPEFWNVTQQGAMDALAYLMARRRCKSDNPNETEPWGVEIPADVSEDFKLHWKAWVREKYRVAADNSMGERWKKVAEKAPDHLYMCCTYLALWLEMAEMVGAISGSVEITNNEIPQSEAPDGTFGSDSLAVSAPP